MQSEKSGVKITTKLQKFRKIFTKNFVKSLSKRAF